MYLLIIHKVCYFVYLFVLLHPSVTVYSITTKSNPDKFSYNSVASSIFMSNRIINKSYFAYRLTVVVGGWEGGIH